MGIGTYFLGLLLSGFVGLILHVVIKMVTSRLEAGFVRAVLRSFPVAVALAPAMLMKKGLGVLLPASIVLFAARSSHSPDADDVRNFSGALTSLAVVWVIAGVILFLRYIVREDRKIQNPKELSDQRR